MATERQIAANRANALNTSGPKTAEGKARVARNATRHGLLAAGIVLKEEDKDRFSAHVDAMIERFHPRDVVEQRLIEAMARAYWCQMRVATLQTAAFEVGMVEQPEEVGCPAIRSFFATKQSADTSNVLDLLRRYDTTFERQYYRALNTLESRRAGKPEPATHIPTEAFDFGGTWITPLKEDEPELPSSTPLIESPETGHA